MPEMKRFISMDPLGFADSMNLYETFGCDPVNNVDPWGLSAWSNFVDDFSSGIENLFSGTVVRAGFVLGVEFADTNDYYWRFNIAAGKEYQLHDNVRATYEYGMNLYTGGIATQISKTGTLFGDVSNLSYDFYGSILGIVGWGEADEMPFYPFNTLTRSPISDTFEQSFSKGVTWYYNKFMYDWTQTGFYGLRYDKLSATMHNDVKLFSGSNAGTDQGWTGGGIVSYLQGNGVLMELGHEAFTNKRNYWKRIPILITI